MNINSAIHTVTGEHLQVENTNDSYRLEFTEIVPLATRDTDGSCTTEYVSGDWSAEFKPGTFAVVKQEPGDDYKSSAVCSVNTDAVPAEVRETQSHVKPADVLETFDLARLPKNCNVWTSTGDSLTEVGADVTERADNEKPMSYLCIVCDKRFAVSKNLRRHIRRLHTGDDSYACSQCEKRFSSQDTLRHHMYVHTSKYKCADCDKCFPSSRHLAEHRRTHSGEKPFLCTVCGRAFTISHQLVRHSRIHSEEKPYRCFVCDKAFRQSGHLTVHMRVHTGEKSYVCSLCDKSFSVSSDLQRHKLCVHGSGRPFLCTYCGKTFKTKGELKSHVRVHTGAKPYSCGHCSHCFTSCKVLKRHLLKSHNELGDGDVNSEVGRH